MDISDDFAGHSDWRLPTKKELHSLVYCPTGRRGISLDSDGRTSEVNGKRQNGRCLSKGYSSPTINKAAFPNTSTALVWSSSPYANDSSYAWGVYFGSGYDGADGKDFSYYVRLVRSGQ